MENEMQRNRKTASLFLSIIMALLAAGSLLLIHSADLAASSPGTMPSYGAANLKVADISQYNDAVNTNSDDINFAVLKTQVDAVYIRAFGNSGTGIYIDMQATRYAKAAQAAGLKFGFYLFYIPTADLENSRSQARSYYNFIKDFGYSCIPALDVEDNRNNLTKAQLAAAVKAFADEFKSLSRLDLMVYSYPDFISNNFDTTFNWSAYKLWIAHYNVSLPMEGISQTWMPSSKWSWSYWDMWQYTSKGTLSSIPNSSGGSLDLSHATDNILLAPPTSAEITSLVFPDNITAGKSFSAQITVKNTDKVAWTESTYIRLGVEGTSVGNNRVFLPVGASVAPGNSYTFTYTAAAPVNGDLSLNVRMIKDGVCWFGDTKTFSVKARDAQIISVNTPTGLMTGQTQDITVTVKNTGLSVWNADSYYRLATDASNTPSNRSYLPSGTKVAPGGTCTFTTAVQAMNTPGTAMVNLQMVQDGVTFFGQKNTIQIPVKNPSTAEITSVSMPDTITAGNAFTAQITVKNTDSVTWTEKDMIRLGIEGTAIGNNRVHLPEGVSVKAGESYTFTFTASAPSDRDLILHIQMIKDGVCWFGDVKTVTVKARDAQILSTDAPAQILAGQSQDIQVTVKNTGLLVWNADTYYRLATDASNTPSTRYFMPSGTKVAPGGTYIFTVTVQAPVTGAAVVNLQMVQDGVTFFGQKSTLQISLKKPSAAAISSISMPDTIKAGSAFTAQIAVKNTDSVIWTEKDMIRLGIEGTAIGSNRVQLPAGVSVKPGETYTFAYTATAPATGDLTLNIQMIKDGVCWVGEAKTVTVKESDAQIQSVNAPAQLLVGQSLDITVTVINTGLTTWNADTYYRLATDASNTVSNRAYMSGGTKVAPGGTYTFTATVQAPNVPGTAVINLQMVQDGVTFFGQKSTLQIPVINP